MRNISLKFEINPNTFAPTKRLFVGDQYAGVSLFMETMQDAMAFGNVEEVVQSIKDQVNRDVPLFVPDVTDEEMMMVRGLIGGAIKHDIT